MKSLAIIGSSGGNLYFQGGSQPQELIGELITQVAVLEAKIKFVAFVGADASMDALKSDTKARLYTLEDNRVVATEPTSLVQANEAATMIDLELAALIESGQIDGLVAFSANPEGVNKASIKAAAKAKIPVVGTGGTSMAAIKSAGAKVIGVSGTTGTTNRTRAVFVISAFAREWQLKYRPAIDVPGAGGNSLQVSWNRIGIRGVMMAAFPAFIMLALLRALSQIGGFASLGDTFELLSMGIPVILAALAARKVSGMDELGIIAGIIAGIILGPGGMIGGLLVGTGAGFAVIVLVQAGNHLRIPATTVNILAGGGAGLAVGIIGQYLVTPWAMSLGDLIRSLLDSLVAFNPLLVGAFFGLMIWFSLLKGFYHAVIFPLILLEMETTGFSFVGSIDLVCLVVVSAGVQLAQIIKPTELMDRAVAKNNIYVNLVFGTYVEASFPYILKDKIMFGATIVAATCSGALVGWLGLRATAYVPVFLAPLLTNPGHNLELALAGLVTLGFTTALMVMVNLINTRSGNQ